jgi:hypothetical protein
LNAVQRNWRTPATFEQCPDACSLDALTEYASRLTKGTVFARYAYGQSVTVTAQKGEKFPERRLPSAEQSGQGMGSR